MKFTHILALALALAMPGAMAQAQSAAPSTAAKPPAAAAKPAPAAKAALLDINTAKEAELEALPQIGPVRAKAIIAGRPYASKDQLVSKKILSQGIYDKIKDQIIAKQK